MTSPSRVRRLALAAAGVLLACAPLLAADKLAHIPNDVHGAGAERPPLIVVGDQSYPPYLFLDADGHATGLVADAWALWESKTGVHVTLMPLDWSEAQRQIADGRADVIETVFRTPERERALDFTPPYADVPVAIYARADLGTLEDMHALAGKRVATLAGAACVEQLRAGGVGDIVTYPNYDRLVDAAIAGGPPLFCMDAPAADYLLSRMDSPHRFHRAFVLFHGQLHRAVRRGDAQTLALVERGFASFTPQEQRSLEDKWLGMAPDGLAWTRTLKVLAVVSTLAMVLIVAWGLAMRRAVREQTAVIDGERLRLRTLINALPDLVWFKGPDGRFLACNPRFEQFIGAPEARLAGHREHDFLDTALADELADIDRRAAEAGAPIAHRFEFVYASDGHREIVESLHTPVIGAGGIPSGVLSIARDVTQRQLDEVHLRRLNRLYKVLTNVHAAIARERAREPLFKAICRIMVEDGGLRMAWVGAPDQVTRELRPVAWSGASGVYLDPPHTSLDLGPLGASPSACAFREGHAMHATDIARDPGMAAWRTAALAHGYFSSSAYPLRVDGRTVAVLTMYSDTVEFFDADELALLDRLSTDISLALEGQERELARERAVAELRDSQARFATIFRTSPIGIGIARNEDKRYIDVNDAFIALFGHSREDAMYKNGIELNTWVEPEARMQAMRILARDGEVHDFEARFRKRDGDIFHAAFSATRVSVGREDLVIASYTDLTAQRLATRTLEERKLELERIVSQRTAELGNILDAMPDLFFRMKHDGTIVDYRAGREADLYMPPEQFLGRRVSDVLPPEAAQAIQQAIEHATCTDTIVVAEYPLLFPDGEQYFESRLRRLHPDQVIAFVRNITDRRSLEADRERARRRAEELANAKSEFLANMSHEIRTPLNGLLGLAQIGQRASADPGTRGTFDAILASGRLLMGIVNDVLDFSKIEVGKMHVEQRRMAPQQLAEEAVALLRERAIAKRIALDLEVEPDVPEVCLGDPLRTQQILVNLISNAVKFTEAGGVRVTLSIATDLLDDGMRTPWLMLRVADTGIGIEARQIRLLFTPFEQADTSTTRRFGGTGLGLAISRRLAELMGGTIHVDSEPGRGSVFELRLPLVDAPASAGLAVMPEVWADSARRLSGVRVLVAEDNEVNQMVLERALGLEDARVTLVGDGRQAVNRVLAEGSDAFDIVLMDIQMPEMDGYEATRRILELAPRMPVIGQTAHVMQDERRECLAAGMVDHIAKPIDFRHLVDLIVRHLG